MALSAPIASEKPQAIGTAPKTQINAFNEIVVKALTQKLNSCTRPFEAIEWRSVCVFLQNKSSDQGLIRDGIKHVVEEEIQIENDNGYVVNLPNFDIRKVDEDIPLEGEKYQSYALNVEFKGYHEGDIVLVDHEWVNELDSSFQSKSPLYGYIYRVYAAALANEYKWHVKIPCTEYNPGIPSDLILMCKRCNILTTFYHYTREVQPLLEKKNTLEKNTSEAMNDNGSKDFLDACLAMTNDFLLCQAEEIVRSEDISNLTEAELKAKIDQHKRILLDELQTAADKDMQDSNSEKLPSVPEFRQKVKALFKNHQWQFGGQKITHQVKMDLLEFLHPQTPHKNKKKAPAQVFSMWHDPTKYSLSPIWASKVTGLYTAMLGLKPHQRLLEEKQGQTPEAFEISYNHYLTKLRNFSMGKLNISETVEATSKIKDDAVVLESEDTDSDGGKICDRTDDKQLDLEKKQEVVPTTPPSFNQSLQPIHLENNFFNIVNGNSQKNSEIGQRIMITCLSRLLEQQIDRVMREEDGSVNESDLHRGVQDAKHLCTNMDCRNEKFTEFVFAARNELKTSQIDEQLTSEIQSDIQKLSSQLTDFENHNSIDTMVEKLQLLKKHHHQRQAQKSQKVHLYEMLCTEFKKDKELMSMFRCILMGDTDDMHEPLAKRQKILGNQAELTA